MIANLKRGVTSGLMSNGGEPRLNSYQNASQSPLPDVNCIGRAELHQPACRRVVNKGMAAIPLVSRGQSGSYLPNNRGGIVENAVEFRLAINLLKRTQKPTSGTVTWRIRSAIW